MTVRRTAPARAGTLAAWAGLCAVGIGADAGAWDDAAVQDQDRRDRLVVTTRPWLPVEAVALALPTVPTAGPDEELAEWAADRALLAAARHATAGRAASVQLERDDAARYLVGTALPGDLDAVRRAFERLAGEALPTALVAAADSAAQVALAFRRDAPGAQFDAAFHALLDETRSAPPARVRAPSWVLVRQDPSSPRLGPAPGSGTPPFLAAPRPAAPDRRPASGPAPARAVRRHVPAEVVTTWVGSAYRLPPKTTLSQAHLLRTLLEDWLDPALDPALYEFAAGIDHDGRLLVRFSASPEAAAQWETRLDRAFSELAAPEHGDRVAALLRRTRGLWSRRLADPAELARVAAAALARGASPEQVLAHLSDLFDPPPPDEIAAAARGATLTARLVYGT